MLEKILERILCCCCRGRKCPGPPKSKDADETVRGGDASEEEQLRSTEPVQVYILLGA